MDAIEFIKNDHKRIEELFQSFYQAEDVEHQNIFKEIETALTAHADMEEKVFYPALKQFAPEEVEQALEEHREVKEILLELLDADLIDEQFESQFNRLVEDVRHHVEEEESAAGLLEVAREHFDEQQLSSMTAQMQRIQQGTEEELAA